jgi:eukaryotic-like serine/threonine-protein kinase
MLALSNVVSIGPGAILGGKYRLEDSIGKGGMGEVFEATTLANGQRVAVKIVNRAFLDSTLVERLRREAEAATRVQSEFVPQLYDVDKTPDGELFLVMELLQGETLSALLRRRGGLLAWEEILPFGEDVLRGLFDAHAAGVIHRDLKPGNIFIESMPGRRDRARILDFGVCKLDVHDGESLTSTGEAVGTIAYMAPEQIRGAAHVDERADVYAFAMVVFEALCGRLAYDASGSIALIASKLEKSARHVRELTQMAIPEELDTLLARCLARRPSDRPASVGELLLEWQALGPPTVAPLPLGSSGRFGDSATETGLTAAPTNTRVAGGSRAGLLVAGAALVASCVVLGFAVLHRADTSEAPATETIATPEVPVEPPLAAPPPPAPEPSIATFMSPLDLPAAPPQVADGDAGHPARPVVRWRPGKRTSPQTGTTHRAPTEPQIQTEPRY